MPDDGGGSAGEGGTEGSAGAGGAAGRPEGEPDPQYTFDCADEPPPTTAPTRVELFGLTNRYALSGDYRRHIEPGVTVEVYRRSDDTLLASTISDEGSAWSLKVPTGGVPIEVYLVATKAGFVPTHHHPARPLLAMAQISLNLLTPETVDAVYARMGERRDACGAVLATFAYECSSYNLRGGVMSSSPHADRIAYTRDSAPRPGATTIDWDTLTFFLDVPPGPVTTTVDYFGHTISRTVTARTDAVVVVELQP